MMTDAEIAAALYGPGRNKRTVPPRQAEQQAAAPRTPERREPEQEYTAPPDDKDERDREKDRAVNAAMGAALEKGGDLAAAELDYQDARAQLNHFTADFEDGVDEAELSPEQRKTYAALQARVEETEEAMLRIGED